MNSYFPIENCASVAEGHFYRMRGKGPIRGPRRQPACARARRARDMTTHSECLLLISSRDESPGLEFVLFFLICRRPSGTSH